MQTVYSHTNPAVSARFYPTFLFPPIVPHVGPTREINSLLDQAHAQASRCEIPRSIRLLEKAEEQWVAVAPKRTLPKETVVYFLLTKGFFHSLQAQAVSGEEAEGLTKQAVIYYMEAIDLAETILPHTADTALPRIYLALELFYHKAFERATLLLKQAEAIISNSEGPRSLYAQICSYDLIACYIAMLQYIHAYKAGVLPTAFLQQLQGIEHDFPMNLKAYATLDQLGNASYQGLRQGCGYLEQVINDPAFCTLPGRRSLESIIEEGFGRTGCLFSKTVQEEIKEHPELYDGCDSLILFDFLQASQAVQSGSLTILEPKGKDQTIGALASERLLEQKEEAMTKQNQLKPLSGTGISINMKRTLARPSSGSSNTSTGKPPINVAFNIEARAHTLDEDALYSAIDELRAIEETMGRLVGPAHAYTTTVHRLLVIAEALQEEVVFTNTHAKLVTGAQAFKKFYASLKPPEIKPLMLGSGGKPKKGKKGAKGKKGKKGKK